MGKSLAVSRHGPRSMATTSKPASVSSCARIEPVHPRPIMTASLRGSLRAMLRLFKNTGRAVPPVVNKSSLCPVRMIVDADGRQRDPLVMAIDPVAIIVMRPRKADHLPGGHVFVTAIDRIGKKTALRVLEDLAEELLAVEA